MCWATDAMSACRRAGHPEDAGPVGGAAWIRTNDLPAGRVSDVSSSSPVVLPDGGVLYGAVTSYNYARGHLFKFGSDGRALATYDFGWDIIRLSSSTADLLDPPERQSLPGGLLLREPERLPPQAPRYDITSLDSNLLPEWRFTSTNTLSCQRDAGGAVTCVSDHPDGFEWCINQPAVDANGVAYANSEDGFLTRSDGGASRWAGSS